MKIKIRNRRFIDRYTCVDTWNEYFVDNRTTECGGMTQFYKGGYTFMAVANEDYVVLN